MNQNASIMQVDPNSKMAYLNIRVLLVILGLVVALNITKTAMSSERQVEIKHLQGAQLAVMNKENNDTSDNIFGLLLNKMAKTTAAPTTVDRLDSETCLNTDVTADAEFDELKANRCPNIPPDLGPDFQSPGLDWMSDVLAGGYFPNKKCHAQQRVAIIVPHSGPQKDLIKFLNHMHPFLVKQQAEYQIFVIDYVNKSSALTHGFLFNVGYQQALKHRNWDCLIFHEHHLVPMDSRNLYRCNWYPKQLVGKIETEQITDSKTDAEGSSLMSLPSATTLAGAIALSWEQFLAVNGFSNHVAGRDGPYLQLYNRIQMANYTLDVNDPLIGQYKNVAEPFDTLGPMWLFFPFFIASRPYNIDGLSTLSYKVEETIYQTLFTYIKVSKSEDSGDKTFRSPLKVINA